MQDVVNSSPYVFPGLCLNLKACLIHEELQAIMIEVSADLGITIADIRSGNRNRHILDARDIFIIKSHMSTTASLKI